MINAGLYPRRTPSGFLLFALLLALGLALAPQTAQAATGETEAGTSLPGAEDALFPLAQTPTAAEIVVADKNWNNGNKNWNKHWYKNNNWNKKWGKNNKYKNNHYHYKYTKKVYVQPWARRPYYGQFFGGIVLGSILTAAAIGVAPPPPAPELCWYWMDPYRSRGYWDYCPGY